MKAPLTTFTGFIKQVDRASVDPVGQCVLDTAFPRFWPSDPNSEDARRRTDAFKRMGVDYLFHDVNTPRRFAGCWSLPRGRYFTLCDDGTGDDRHTLVNELTAYVDPLRGGLLLFADMGVPEAVTLFKQYDRAAEPGPFIAVIMIGRPGAVSPVIDALAERGFVQDADREQRQQYCLIGARIPYRVEHVQIPNAFDLRLIDCQHYVVEEFFKKDSAKLTKSDRSGIDSFVESLPVLMQPELGGGAMGGDEGAILQAFAAFLGAQALV